MLQELKNLSQVLSLDFRIRLRLLSLTTEVKVIENVFNLCDLIVFQSAELLIVDSEVFVFSCAGFTCESTSLVTRCNRL